MIRGWAITEKNGVFPKPWACLRLASLVASWHLVKTAVLEETALLVPRIVYTRAARFFDQFTRHLFLESLEYV